MGCGGGIVKGGTELMGGCGEGQSWQVGGGLGTAMTGRAGDCYDGDRARRSGTELEI